MKPVTNKTLIAVSVFIVVFVVGGYFLGVHGRHIYTSWKLWRLKSALKSETDGKKLSQIKRAIYELGPKGHEFLVDGLPYLVVNGLMILGIVGFLACMNLRLTLYVLVPVPVIIGLSIFFWRRLRGIFHKFGQNWGRLNARLNEALAGIRVVKAFAQEPREIEWFETGHDHLPGVALKRMWMHLNGALSA